MTTSQTSQYLVQCASQDPSHTFVATPGSALEKRCIERERAGKLDALILAVEECASCTDEAQTRARRAQEYDMDLWT
jgi:hypothetical protein